MKKIHDPKKITKFEQIPNIGPSMAQDFKLLGLKQPKDLALQDPYELYVKLCKKTRSYQDPCVLDTFIAATTFMKGKGDKDWWAYTEERKKNFSKVQDKIERFK